MRAAHLRAANLEIFSQSGKVGATILQKWHIFLTHAMCNSVENHNFAPFLKAGAAQRARLPHTH
jgi:hypothetical protein